jgi:hypothetical protein
MKSLLAMKKTIDPPILVVAVLSQKDTMHH